VQNLGGLGVSIRLDPAARCRPRVRDNPDLVWARIIEVALDEVCLDHWERLRRARRVCACQIEPGDEEFDEFTEFLQVRFAERRLGEKIADCRCENVRAAQDGREMRILASQEIARIFERKSPMTMAIVVFIDALTDDRL
jgi:hypothetical protein